MDAVNALELAMVRMGFDFETHATKRVRYTSGPWMPIGSEGEIIYTVPGAYAEIQVKWDRGECYAHRWDEVAFQ